MAIRLSTATLVMREEILVSDDSLIILENETISDRMRRILLEQVSSVVLCRRFPLLRVLIAAGVLLVPAGLLLLTKEVAAYYVSGVLSLLFLLIALCHAWYGHTTIEIHYLGGSRRFRTVSSPRRVRRFMTALRENITRAQDAARTREGR